MDGYDGSRTNRSKAIGSFVLPTFQALNMRIPAALQLIGPVGSLLCYQFGGSLYVYNADGTPRWTLVAASSDVAIAANGTVITSSVAPNSVTAYKDETVLHSFQGFHVDPPDGEAPDLRLSRILYGTSNAGGSRHGEKNGPDGVKPSEPLNDMSGQKHGITHASS